MVATTLGHIILPVQLCESALGAIKRYKEFPASAASAQLGVRCRPQSRLMQGVNHVLDCFRVSKYGLPKL